MMIGGPHGVFLVALILSRTFALPQPPAPSNDITDYEDDEAPNMFLRQTRKHARPMFYINCGYRDLCYCYSKITRHHYCCSCDVGACFPASARVATSAEAYTTMDSLRTGDEVLAVDESGKVVTSPVLGFMDRRPNERALYVTIRTAIGRNLTLSPNHVLFKSSPNSSYPISAFGSDISVGDVIFSVNKTGLERTKVVAIEHSISTGAYVPLTKEGTLIVDGAFASCYASYRHSLAHTFLAPARAFPVLLWPRPGFISNVALFLKNMVNTATANSLDALQNFFEEMITMIEEGLLLKSAVVVTSQGGRMGGTTSEWIAHVQVESYNNRENAHYPSFFGKESTDFEELGEAYYITFVKLIGWFFFWDQKAITPVIQVNSQVDVKGMFQLLTFTNTFANLPFALLDLVPRSW